MTDITLRKVNLKDILLIYYWFNDKHSIQFKIRTKNKIMFRDHKIWFRDFFKKKAGKIWIIKYKDIDIGNIRLNKINYKIFDIDIFIIEDYRGLKIASKALQMMEKKLVKGSVIHSNVKKINTKSYKFFIKNNFKLHHSNKEIWFLKKYI